MSDPSLFAGPALRRLRKREQLTQASMASRLTISPSYLNLIERNQRPLTARVIMQLVEQFDFDPRSLRDDPAIGGVEGLVRRLADERFGDLGIDREEIVEFLATAPQVAAAFSRLYDRSGTLSDAGLDPLTASRREIERWRNHFADLDHAAEALADELRLSRGDIGSALAERLRERHQLAVRILPREVMPETLRKLDLHARQVQISETLSAESRNFQLAMQLAQLEFREAIGAIADGARFGVEGARGLFHRHLVAYFAAALIMPYGRFLRACEGTGYDFVVLQRRFGVSFEQLAHRLTTLQRVGQRGLPFFMVRIDRAGQLSKRFSGASGATFFDGGESCPLWSAHRAFEAPADFHYAFVTLDDGGAAPSSWFTAAHAVDGSGLPGESRFVVVVGIDTALTAELAAAGQQPRQVQRIGPGCARCHLAGCRQRSLPPQGRKLVFDTVRHGSVPFEFAGESN